MPADRIAVDANVLVYALYRDAPQHATSRAFLDRAQHDHLTLCFTSQTLAEFFSIVTSARRVSDPRTPQEAVGAIQSILALPGATLLSSEGIGSMNAPALSLHFIVRKRTADGSLSSKEV